jgi:hypothetical protein
VRTSGRSKRTCSVVTRHTAVRAAGVVDAGAAVTAATGPGACAVAGAGASNPAAAAAPQTAARRKKRWQSMMSVSSLLEDFASFLLGFDSY